MSQSFFFCVFMFSIKKKSHICCRLLSWMFWLLQLSPGSFPFLTSPYVGLYSGREHSWVRLRVHRGQAASAPPMISPGPPGVHSPAVVEEAASFLAVVLELSCCMFQRISFGHLVFSHFQVRHPFASDLWDLSDLMSVIYVSVVAGNLCPPVNI